MDALVSLLALIVMVVRRGSSSSSSRKIGRSWNAGKY
jgi:hypothetical protein